MRLSLHPDVQGPHATPAGLRMRRVSPHEAEVHATFSAPLPASTEVSLHFGQLHVQPPRQRPITLHLADSGLWRSRWEHDRMSCSWLDGGRTLHVRLHLLTKYESVPDLPPFEAITFPEAPWLIMTERQWRDAVDRHG